MKKYTQEDFDNFEVNERGFKICPSGDYSNIKEFGVRCSFGEWCSFGERCSFGKCCSFGERCKFHEGCSIESNVFKLFLKFEGFGRERRCTYFYLLEDDSIFVRCGCFSGNADEFEKKIKETHGNNFYAQGYLKVLELAKWQFEASKNNKLGDENNG